MKSKLSSTSPLQTGLYKTTTKMFFTPSKLIEAQITELFDDIWLNVTALKNLRWQVKGYYEEMPIKTNLQLSKKFVFEEDKSVRPNLYRKCIDQTWEDQQFYISKTLLTNVFAIYEAWVDNISNLLCIPENRGKNMQFPIDKYHNYLNFLNDLQRKKNPALVENFYETYKMTNPNYHLDHLNNYLRVYRYFKECRNNIIHNGGDTTQTICNKYNDIKNLSPTDLDVAEVPQIIPSLQGEPIRLSLRGVVGFTQLILKIVATFDVEFIKCKRADLYFCDRIKEDLKVIPYPTCLTSQTKKIQEINNIVQRGRFRKPINPLILYPLLKNNGVMR